MKHFNLLNNTRWFATVILLLTFCIGQTWGTTIASWGKISISASTDYKATGGDANNNNTAKFRSTKAISTGTGTYSYYGSGAGGSVITFSNLNLSTYTSIQMTFYSRASSGGSMTLAYSMDGSSWVDVGSATINGTESQKTISGIPYYATYLRLTHSASSGSLYFGTVVISGSAATMRTVTWYVDGETTTTGSPTTSVPSGSTVGKLPTVPSSCDPSKVFVGWSASEIDGETDTEPSDLFNIYLDAPTVSANTNYHAVFAKATPGVDNDQAYSFINSTGMSNSTKAGWTVSQSPGSYDGTYGASWLRNNLAALPTFTFTPSVKISKITVRVRQSNTTGSNTVACSAGGTTIATNSMSGTTQYNMEFTPSVASKGTIVVAATNTSSNSTGQGSFYVASITLTEDATTYSKYVTSCGSCEDDPTVGAASLNGSFSLSSVGVQCASASAGDGCSLSEYGFVWGTSNTSGHPNKDDNVVTNAGAYAANYTNNLTSTFVAGNTYYYRGYAKNNGDNYGYSSVIQSFTPYTVNYNKNNGSAGGSAPSQQVVNTGGTVTLAPATGNFTLTGYYIAKWAVGSAGGTQYTPNTTSPTISGNTTFYAIWEANTYAITLNGNGATGAGSPASVNATYNAHALSSAITNPTKTDYIFEGWNTKADGSGLTVIGTDGELIADVSGYTDEDGNWTKAGTETLYAKWTEHTYTNYRTSCCTDPGLAYGTGSVNKTFGDGTFTNTLTNSNSVSVSYESSDTDVATVASDGTVTIKGAGSATITASSAAQTVSTVAYCADEVSYTLTVAKADISPSLSYSSDNVTVDETSGTPTVSGNSGSGAVTYAITSISPAGCATINTSTGVVTGVAVGSITVTATIAATDNYNGSTATADLSIISASYFPKGKTIFIQAHSTSAWTGDGCVMAWFHTSGGSETAQETYWLFDATGDDSGKKLFATVAPATGDLPYLDIQRFAANCSTWWNKNGGCSYADASGSNAIRSTGKHDTSSDGDYVRWNDTGVTLDLHGDPSGDDWASSLASFSDQGAGVWTATYSNYAPANAAGESQDFKAKTNYNGWIGNTGSNNNATLDGMHVGSTYNITATLDITDHSLTMSKTYVKGTVHFDLQGHGSSISDLTNVTAGSTISAPSAPSADGWTFGGWYREPACTNAWTFASDVVNETMTLYAKWTRTPVITVSETSRAFGTKKVNGSYTMTFTVSGVYLQGNIGLAISGTNSAMFSVDETSLAPSTGTVSTTTITVTYTPTTAAAHSASVDITSTGAVTKNVALTGTGRYEDTYMTAMHEAVTAWSSYASGVTKAGDGYTIPNPGDIAAGDREGTGCEGIHYHFAGWVEDAYKASPSGHIIDASGTEDASNKTFWAVWEKESAGSVDGYLLVEDDDDLSVGDKILIANAKETSANVLGYQRVDKDENQTNRGYASGVTITSKLMDPTIATSNSETTKAFEIELQGTSSGWYFYDAVNDGYLQANGGTSSNKLTYHTGSSHDNHDTWTIAVDDGTGVATIQTLAGTTSSNKGWMRYNSSSTLFSCYNSGQADIYVFRYAKEYEDPKVECICSVNPSAGTAAVDATGTFSSSRIDVKATSASTGHADCSYTDYGFVWSSSVTTPTLVEGTGAASTNCTKVPVGNDGEVTSFTGSLEGSFSANNAIYFRSYAKNGKSDGTYQYSSVVTITPRSVTFNLNGHGSSAPATQLVNNGSKATDPSYSESVTGYIFGGWYKEEGCSNAWNFASDVVSGENKTLYAKWTPITYSVQFNSNDANYLGTATGSMSDQSFNYDESKDLTGINFSLAGYDFAGWALTPTGDVEHLDEAEVENLSSTNSAIVNLYAIWTAKKYNVTLAATNETSSVGSQTVQATHNAAMPLVTTADKTPAVAAPSRTGYTFTGWEYSSTTYYNYNAGTSTLSSAHVWDQPNSTTTLTPKWSINSYTLTWDLAGGTVATAGTGASAGATGTPSSSVEYNAAITVPTVTKSGYDFAGWDVTPASNMPAVATTYTATWTAKTLNSISLAEASVSVYVGEIKYVNVIFDPTDILSKAFSQAATPSYCQLSSYSSYNQLKITGGRAGADVSVDRTETVSIKYTADETKTASITVTVKPLPTVTFVDNIHNKDDFANSGNGWTAGTGVLSSTVTTGVVSHAKKTPTHTDVSAPVGGNACETGHLHLMGWIRSDYSKVADYMNGTGEAPSVSDLTTAGAEYWFLPDADINTETYNGKTFYAVWAVEE